MSDVVVESSTQKIVVNPASSSVSVISAGPQGPAGSGGGGGGVDIDDGVTNLTDTWSSQKISDEIATFAGDVKVLNGTNNNDTSALEAFVNALSAGDKVRLSGTFDLDSSATLTPADGVEIDARGAEFILASGIAGGSDGFQVGIRVEGTGKQGQTGLISNMVKGDRVINVGTHSMSVGATAILQSGAQFSPLRTQHNVSQWVRVLAETSVTLDIDGAAESDYNTTDVATVEEVVLCDRFTWRGGTFTTATGSGRQTPILFEDHENLTVKDIKAESDGRGRDGVVLRRVLNAKVSGVVANGFKDNTVVSNVEGYGLWLLGCQNVDVTLCSFWDCRHGFDIGGYSGDPISRDINVKGGVASGCSSAGWSTHGGSQRVKMEGVSSLWCGGGVIVRGPDSIVRNCFIFGHNDDDTSNTYDHGVTVGEANNGGSASNDWEGRGAENLIIEGNIIDLQSTGGRSKSGVVIKDTVKNTRIVNNTIVGTTTALIHLAANGEDVHIHGNIGDWTSSTFSARAGVIVQPATQSLGQSTTVDTNARIDYISIRDFTVYGLKGPAIRIASFYTDRVDVSGIVNHDNRSGTTEQIEIAAGTVNNLYLDVGCTSLNTGTVNNTFTGGGGAGSITVPYHLYLTMASDTAEGDVSNLIKMHRPGTITKYYVMPTNSPANDSLIVDLTKGTATVQSTIMTTPANRAEVGIGAVDADSGVPDDASFLADDYLQFLMAQLDAADEGNLGNIHLALFWEETHS